jgi:glycosyltransferase involved in cell wall biosynthesis
MKKSIGIVIPSLRKYGGAERYMIELCRYLYNEYDITLYAPDINLDLLREHNINSNVEKVELRKLFPITEKYNFILNSLVISKYWKKQIKEHDLYLCNTFPAHLIDKKPMLWFPHEPLRAIYDLKYEGRVLNSKKNSDDIERQIHIYPKERYDTIENQNISDFEAIADVIQSIDNSVIPDITIANSKYCADYIKRSIGINCQDIIYPGCDQNPFINLKKDQNLFITVSQLWAHKRINLLIEAIKQVEESKLIIVGAGPEKENLKDICKFLDLNDRVFFIEGLKNHEIQLLLARSCAFLFSAIREPFGIVVLEAMAAGCPIIAVNEGGYVETLTNKNSFLCNPYPSEFATAMRNLQSDEKLRFLMSNESIKISKKYTWKKSSESLKKNIEQLLKLTKVKSKINKKDSNFPLVGVQYYAWYGEGFGSEHWNDTPDTTVKISPSLGFYSSTKGEIIKRHLQMMISSKIDYLIINLHIDNDGVNKNELISANHIRNIILKENLNIKLCIQIVPSKNFLGLERTFNAIEVFFDDYCYLKKDNKPILYWFWSSEFDYSSFFNLDIVRRAKKNCLNFAQSLREPKEINEENLLTKGFFDSFYFYSPLEIANEKNLEKIIIERSKILSQFKYFSYTVSPGYNDIELQQSFRSKNTLRIVARNEGKTYENTFKIIKELKCKPDFITITSFNEFHEQTNIEPDTVFGDTYLKLTNKLIQKYILK